jgi:hypothetical protein
VVYKTKDKYPHKEKAEGNLNRQMRRNTWLKGLHKDKDRDDRDTATCQECLEPPDEGGASRDPVLQPLEASPPCWTAALPPEELQPL